MNWFDIVALLIIIGIAWLESVRGFGRAIFDLVGAIIAMKLADVLSEPLATAAPIATEPGPSQAFWLAIVFVVLAVLVVIATKLIYDSTLLSLDVLDPAIGAVLGVVSGMVVAHVFMKMLEVGYAGTEFSTVVLNSFMGQELLRLRTYHHVVASLQNISNW